MGLSNKVFFRLKEDTKDRFEIVVEDTVWREVHTTIFGRHPVFPQILSLDHLQEVFDEFEIKKVRAYLLWRLSCQSYHSDQLRKMLSERLVQQKTIEHNIKQFVALGLLNDEAWLETFVRLQKSRMGTRLIIAKLKSKGITEKSLRALSLEKDEEDKHLEIEAMVTRLRTKFGRRDLTQAKERQKVFCFFLRKGYEYDQIKQAFFCYQNSR